MVPTSRSARCAVAVREIPCDRRRNAEDQREGADLIDDRYAGLEHADRAVEHRSRQPDPDEQGGPGGGIEPGDSVSEMERRERDEAADNDNQDVHKSPLLPS